MKLHEREEIRRRLQTTLDSRKSQFERNQAGQFATPFPLAEQITQAALRYHQGGPVRFLEPGCGTSTFFSALLKIIDQRCIESALGVESDEELADASRQLWEEKGLEIISRDYTTLDPRCHPKANLLITNPPYVRHHHLEPGEKERLKKLERRLLGFEANGLSGLYVHFILLSHAWMEEDGVGVWLVPSEWMDVGYGEALRHYLTEVVTPLRIHLIESEDLQFAEALVSSSVVFFRNRTPSPGHAVQLTAGPLDDPKTSYVENLSVLAGEKKWSQVVKNGREGVRDVSGVTIGNLFRTRRGIATGRNKFFIRPLEEFESLGISKQFLRPILPSARKLTAPVIEATSDGYPDLPDPLALLDCDLPERVVKEEHPSLWKYLNSEEGRRARESYLARHRKIWYSQEEPSPAPFISTYMGRGSKGKSPFRIFFNKSQAIATNTYHLMYPRGPLAQILSKTPSIGSRIAEILAEVVAEGYRSHGRTYGGGLHKLEPSELESLPAQPLLQKLEIEFPTPDQAELQFRA